MVNRERIGLTRSLAGFLWLACLGIAAAWAQQPDGAAVIQRVDAGAQTRYDNVLGFTVIEHYVVFRGQTEAKPAAEMTVRTTYQRGSGKSYAVLAQSGSGIILRFVLQPLLDGEKNVNVPGNVQHSWFTSANYEMKLMPGIQQLDGHQCLAISVSPRHSAPNMIDGTLWVDAKDDSLVKIDGIASKSPSIWTNAPHMMRQYTSIFGYAMATHARAESTSALFGRTVVTIDYNDYKLQLKTGK